MYQEGLIKVQVEHLADSGFQNRITARNHVIITDEPVESGGNDVFANPIELLLGAEGSCTITVLMMFASRMKYDLKNVEIELVHSRVKAEEINNDGLSNGTENGYVHKIEKKIKFIGNLDEEEIEELKSVSKRCPVHSMLRDNSYFELSFEQENK